MNDRVRFFSHKWKDTLLMRKHVESHNKSDYKIHSGYNECQFQISERIKIEFSKYYKVRICSPIFLVHFMLIHF